MYCIRISFIIILETVVILFSSCSPEAEKISYGEEGCQYCQMTIVDPRYGAEIVTTKGKVYKFDAVECMINYANENFDPESDIAFRLVSSFSEPETLNDSKKSTYLISKNMPSPMGMYITAFFSADSAKLYQKRNSGTIMTWNELNDNFHSLADPVN